jgi:hypothetical protein
MEITKEQMLRHHDRLVQLLEHPGHPDQKVHGKGKRRKGKGSFMSPLEKQVAAGRYDPLRQSFARAAAKRYAASYKKKK